MKLLKNQERDISKKEKNDIEIKDQEFKNSLKNIYDEHIFSITHELRSPLSVIYSALHNQYNSLKQLYNSFSSEDQKLIEPQFKSIKSYIKSLKQQADIIESFISSIAEYASYVSDKEQKIVNLHNYLLSILINANSYSRNMKIFANDISFGDSRGNDFLNVNTIVKPHDLSRIIINIMTNAADAVSSAYKEKKSKNKKYSPYLKIRCIKSKNVKNEICLNDSFLRINGEYNDCQPFYIIIEDNGPGISEQNIKKIFEYGYSTKKDDESNIGISHHGIGLNVVMKLAEYNDIKIYIKTSENGTMFVLGLPFVFYEKNQVIISDDAKNSYSIYVTSEHTDYEYKSHEQTYIKMKEESTVKTNRIVKTD